MTAARLNRLYQLMTAAGLDAVAVNPGPTLFYLTGLSFHLMERPTVLLLVPSAVPVLIMPELEKLKIASARIPITPIPFGDNMQEWDGVFKKAVTDLKLDGKRIGVEPTRLRFLELSYLQTAAPQAMFVSGEAALGQVRLQKDAEEIAAMRQAAVIAQNALAATLPLVKPGVTERELAAELLINLFRAGSD
ncbi:aminopeptidase P family protein, partial [bacterium]|nr:aminopeptidase P family protein [bacterium]